MTKNTLKQLIRECIKESLNENAFDMDEAFSSKTVTTPKEAAIILKVADMLSKIGSYTTPSKGKGPNGNVTEIFAGFVKDGKQVARVMISKNNKENEVEIKVEVTSQKWSSTDRNYYDNPVITKSFNIDDSNLIKFLKNPIQGKFDAKASNVTKVCDSGDSDIANKVIDQANDILYKTDRADVANDYDTAALYNTVMRMIQKRKKNGEKQITGKELADIMTHGFNLNEAKPLTIKNLVRGSMVKIKDYDEEWVVVSVNKDKVRVFSVHSYPENRSIESFPIKDIIKVLAKPYKGDYMFEV